MHSRCMRIKAETTAKRVPGVKKEDRKSPQDDGKLGYKNIVPVPIIRRPHRNQSRSSNRVVSPKEESRTMETPATEGNGTMTLQSRVDPAAREVERTTIGGSGEKASSEEKSISQEHGVRRTKPTKVSRKKPSTQTSIHNKIEKPSQAYHTLVDFRSIPVRVRLALLCFRLRSIAFTRTEQGLVLVSYGTKKSNRNPNPKKSFHFPPRLTSRQSLVDRGLRNLQRDWREEEILWVLFVETYRVCSR